MEAGIVAAAVVWATIALGHPWWWLLVLFLAFDLSAAGYLAGTRIGAACYNAVHNYGAAVVAGALAWAFDLRWLAVVALAWGFHVAVDRALGYGLKHADSFQHTHLGWIGRPRP